MKFRQGRCHILFGLVALLQFGYSGGKPTAEDQTLMLQTKVENLIEKILRVIQDYYNQIRTELKCIPDEVPNTIIGTLKKSIDCVDQNERNYDNGRITPNKHKKEFLKCFSDAKAEVKETITSINPYLDYCPENMTEKTYQINLKTTFTRTFQINIKNGLEITKKQVQLGSNEKVCVYQQGRLVSDQLNQTHGNHLPNSDAISEDQSDDESRNKGKDHHSKEHHGKGKGKDHHSNENQGKGNESEPSEESEEIISNANPNNIHAHGDSPNDNHFINESNQEVSDYGKNETSSEEGFIQASKGHGDVDKISDDDDDYDDVDDDEDDDLDYNGEEMFNGKGFDDKFDQKTGDSSNAVSDGHEGTENLHHKSRPHIAQGGENLASPNVKGQHDGKKIIPEQKPGFNENNYAPSVGVGHDAGYDGKAPANKSHADVDFANDNEYIDDEINDFEDDDSDDGIDSGDDAFVGVNSDSGGDFDEEEEEEENDDDNDDDSGDGNVIDDDHHHDGDNHTTNSDYYADPMDEPDYPNYGNEYYDTLDKVVTENKKNFSHSNNHSVPQDHFEKLIGQVNPSTHLKPRIQIKPRNQFKQKPRKQQQNNQRNKIKLPNRPLKNSRSDTASKYRKVTSLSQTFSLSDF